MKTVASDPVNALQMPFDVLPACADVITHEIAYEVYPNEHGPFFARCALESGKEIPAELKDSLRVLFEGKKDHRTGFLDPRFWEGNLLPRFQNFTSALSPEFARKSTNGLRVDLASGLQVFFEYFTEHHDSILFDKLGVDDRRGSLMKRRDRPLSQLQRTAESSKEQLEALAGRRPVPFRTFWNAEMSVLPRWQRR
jgi:hypothetical protein